MSITFSPNPQAQWTGRSASRKQLPKQVFESTDAYQQKIGGEILTKSSKDKVSSGSCCNGLVDASLDAYSNHQKLTLRPEDFWCAIVTQFSFFVNANSETLRSKFVNFEGKKDLEIIDQVYDIRKIDFEKCTKLMTSLIDKNLVNGIKDWILPSFSTTTELDKTVFAGIMMSVTSKYFNYAFGTMCGFPEITLLGTVDDYRNLKSRVARLLQYEVNDGTNSMFKWSNMLDRVIDQLIATASGTPDLSFWNKTINHTHGSGIDLITGWMSVFCVFDSDGKWQGDVFERKVWCAKEPIVSQWPIIDIEKIANGFVTVPVTLKDNVTGIDYPSMIACGSMMYGYTQSDNSGIAPRLDYFLALVDKSKCKIPNDDPFSL